MLSFRPKIVSDVNELISGGSDPVILLLYRYNTFSAVNALISGGIVPVNLFVYKRKLVSAVSLLISGGIEPVRLRMRSSTVNALTPFSDVPVVTMHGRPAVQSR